MAAHAPPTPDDPQPAPRNRGREVQIVLQAWAFQNGYPDVAALSVKRDAFGRSKYGQTLVDDDGRDTFKDCEDEIGDFLAYMMKYKMQLARAAAAGDAHQAADPRIDLLFNMVDAAHTLMCADPSSFPITPSPEAPVAMVMAEPSDDEDYMVVGHSDESEESAASSGIGPYR